MTSIPWTNDNNDIDDGDDELDDQVALDDLTAAQEAANRAHEAAAAALANVNQVSLVIVIIVSIAFIAIIAISLLLTYIIINDSVIITPSVSCPHFSQKIHVAVPRLPRGNFFLLDRLTCSPRTGSMVLRTPQCSTSCNRRRRESSFQ